MVLSEATLNQKDTSTAQERKGHGIHHPADLQPWIQLLEPGAHVEGATAPAQKNTLESANDYYKQCQAEFCNPTCHLLTHVTCNTWRCECTRSLVLAGLCYDTGVCAAVGWMPKKSMLGFLFNSDGLWPHTGATAYGALLTLDMLTFLGVPNTENEMRRVSVETGTQA